MSRRALVDAPLESGVVADLNQDGEGVLREGKTVFVPGALPGERIRFQRRRRHRQHDEAQLVEIEQPADLRVPARCPHFGVCGGCALQHLDGSGQIAVKRAQVASALERLARVVPERWLDDLVGPQWGYRRRARLGVKFVAKRGAVLVGFRERNKPYVAALSRCDILAPPVGELVQPLAMLVDSLQARESIAQIEVAIGDSATVLVLRNLCELGAEDRARLLEFERTRGVRLYLQPGGMDTVQPLQGEPVRLHYALPEFDLTLQFEPTDFVQVNAAVNRALVASAVSLLGAGAGDRVLDLFCGLGNFSLALARRGAAVVGVEGDAALVARATLNAAANGITSAEFHTANLAAAPFEQSPWAQGGYSHVLIDPPRLGAEALLPTIARLAPRRIVYVSCHPGTLARDLGLLVHGHGYALRAAGVVDMFPHTTHVESIALLERSRGR